MPKSILRVSSPDGYRRPRQFVSPETGEPITSPDLSPSSSRPGSPSPPASPSIPRPMSPGTTVRFAKATIHRVEVIGPGRRLLPVKRKSKSTLTYISPLDPGAPQQQKKGGGSPNLLLPKTTLQSPTKLRRHQENQAAMGRYWLRTEEEEAQWRAEAERRAREEAERYRNEPSSPVPGASAFEKKTADGEEAGTGDKAIGAVAKMLPLLDVSGSNDSQALDKLEEVIESEDEDPDEEAGAKCTVKDDETESVELIGTQESKSFSERLAERQAAEEKAHRAASPLRNPVKVSEELSCKADTESSKLGRSSSSGSLAKDQDSMNSEAGSARSSNTSTGSTTTANSSSSSAEQLSRSPPKDKNKEKEKEKETEKARDKPRSASTSSSSSSRSYMNLKPTGDRDRDRDHDRDKTQKPYNSRSTADYRSTSTSNSNSNSNSSSSSSNMANHSRRGSSNHNHLHLSGRRGRRYFESHKLGITA